MTRKRFVKQLMSLGVQRNEANTIALWYNLNGVTYREALVRESVKCSFRNIGKAVVNFAKSVKETTENFKMMAEVLKNENTVN